MTWVRSEYAGELAVLSTWVCALVPWSFSYASEGPITVAVVRFQHALVQFVRGVDLPGAGGPKLLPVWDAPAAGSATVRRAYLAWLVGSAALTVALAVTVAYYLREDRVEAGPVDPVRLLGGLLLLAGVAGAVAVALLWRAYDMVTVPVGVVFLLALGLLLVRIDRG